MKHRFPAMLALAFGTIHFLVVGVAFIWAGGGGEQLFFILFVDFPLFWLAQSLFPGLLYNSMAFNFLLFPVIGTMMYAALGYALGFLFRSKARET